MAGEINSLHNFFYNITNANHHEILVFHKHIQFIHFGSTRTDKWFIQPVSIILDSLICFRKSAIFGYEYHVILGNNNLPTYWLIFLK